MLFGGFVESPFVDGPFVEHVPPHCKLTFRPKYDTFWTPSARSTTVRDGPHGLKTKKKNKIASYPTIPEVYRTNDVCALK